MKIVIFGLAVSSSWGNGHATLWRSLIKALLQRGHTVTFYEKDLPYYVNSRDLFELGRGGNLQFYADFAAVRDQALSELAVADLAIYTSYCPDGRGAAELLLESSARIKCFYDLDTPVTLDGLARNKTVDYLPLDGLSRFDLVLSFTGGRAITELHTKLGARAVATLYGSVDPELHRPASPRPDLTATLSYLGTYAADRQQKLDDLFVLSAMAQPNARFLLAGSLYPSCEWPANVIFLEHLPPQDHAAFFSSCDATLNVTRGAMTDYGYCPSGRLFEAAACEAVILSDWWEGLDTFFTPDKEIFIVESSEDVLRILGHGKQELLKVAEAARQRVLRDHTGEARAIELEATCSQFCGTSV